MAKIMVTGGAGFIGSHTVRRLLDSGHDVVVMDYFMQYVHPLPLSFLENMQWRFDVLLDGSRIIHGSTTHKDELRRAMSDVSPDFVLHLAALPLANVAMVRTEEAFNTILGGTVNLLEVIRDMNTVQKIVYVSSSMVYGDFTLSPMPEEGPKTPKEIYGGMKLAGEILVRVFCRQHEIPYSIVRPSAVYGPTDHNGRVLQVFAENAFQRKPLLAVNPRATVLDFTYVEDVAQGLDKVLLSPEAVNEDFNITRGEARTLSDAIGVLRGLFSDIEVQEITQPTDFRPARGELDTSKARRLVGYEPKYSLEMGLARYVEFLQAHDPSRPHVEPAWPSSSGTSSRMVL
jgi:nucleoside-diphosphate-sugar epimerase